MEQIKKTKFLMVGKRGQAITLGKAPQLVLLLALTAMIGAAAALAVASFQSSTTVGSYAYNISRDGLTSLNNLSRQIPTVGTVVGVALIVVVVIGAFAFFIGRQDGGGL